MFGNASLSDEIHMQEFRDQAESTKGYWEYPYNEYWHMIGGRLKVIGNIYENPELMA
jgi:hypothetical protein